VWNTVIPKQKEAKRDIRVEGRVGIQREKKKNAEGMSVQSGKTGKREGAHLQNTEFKPRREGERTRWGARTRGFSNRNKRGMMKAGGKGKGHEGKWSRIGWTAAWYLREVKTDGRSKRNGKAQDN